MRGAENFDFCTPSRDKLINPEPDPDEVISAQPENWEAFGREVRKEFLIDSSVRTLGSSMPLENGNVMSS